MRNKFMLGLLAALMAVVVAGSSSPVFAQASSAAATGAARWAGSWEGKQEGLPSVVLRVTDNGDALQGQVDFYIIKKVAGAVATNAGKMTVNMVNPHLEGDALVLQVVRVNRDKTPVTNTVFNLSLEPKGDGSAVLRRSGGGEDEIQVEMLRIE